MRQPSNSGRRSRSRPNRKPHGGNPGRSASFESNGPEGRIRGNASQVYEKYISLARDAASSGDRVAAETYYQHAEHYYRIVNDSTDPQHGPRPPQSGDGFQRHRNGRDNQRDMARDADRERGQEEHRKPPAENGADRGQQEAAPVDVPPQMSPDEVTSQDPSKAQPAVAAESIPADGEPAPEEAKPVRAPRGRPRKKAAAPDGEAKDGPVVAKPRRGRRKTATVESDAASAPSEESVDQVEGSASPVSGDAVNS